MEGAQAGVSRFTASTASAVLTVTRGHGAEMPEGVPKNAEFSQLLVYLGISERSEFGFVFWSFAFHR